MKRLHIICLVLAALIIVVSFAYFLFSQWGKYTVLKYNGYEFSYRNDLFTVESANEPRENKSLSTTPIVEGGISIKEKLSGVHLQLYFQDVEIPPNNAYGGIVATRSSEIAPQSLFSMNCSEFGISEDCELVCYKDFFNTGTECRFFTENLETKYPEIYSFYENESDLFYPKRLDLLGMSYSQVFIEAGSVISEKDLDNVRELLVEIVKASK